MTDLQKHPKTATKEDVATQKRVKKVIELTNCIPSVAEVALIDCEGSVEAAVALLLDKPEETVPWTQVSKKSKSSKMHVANASNNKQFGGQSAGPRVHSQRGGSRFRNGASGEQQQRDGGEENKWEIGQSVWMPSSVTTNSANVIVNSTSPANATSSWPLLDNNPPVQTSILADLPQQTQPEPTFASVAATNTPPRNCSVFLDKLIKAIGNDLNDTEIKNIETEFEKKLSQSQKKLEKKEALEQFLHDFTKQKVQEIIEGKINIEQAKYTRKRYYILTESFILIGQNRLAAECIWAVAAFTLKAFVKQQLNRTIERHGLLIRFCAKLSRTIRLDSLIANFMQADSAHSDGFYENKLKATDLKEAMDSVEAFAAALDNCTLGNLAKTRLTEYIDQQ